MTYLHEENKKLIQVKSNAKNEEEIRIYAIRNNMSLNEVVTESLENDPRFKEIKIKKEIKSNEKS